MEMPWLKKMQNRPAVEGRTLVVAETLVPARSYMDPGRFRVWTALIASAGAEQAAVDRKLHSPTIRKHHGEGVSCLDMHL